MSILYIFDCDGVILDSNNIKSEAFANALEQSQLPGADWLVEYNRVNGGMSRHEKFEHYIKKFNLNKEILDDLLVSFASYVTSRLDTCLVSSFFGSDRSVEIASASCVVSGGSEEEIIRTFKKRDLLRYFERGIYGNPISKRAHLHRLIKENLVSSASVYFGDSRLDYEICRDLGINFTFISEWSEFGDWQDFFADKGVPVYCSLSEALGLLDAT